MSKPLLPVLRERNRYLAFEFISDSKFLREDVVKAIWNSALRFLGERGASKISLWVMDWDESKQKGILRVNHKSVEDIRATMAVISEINGIKIIPHVIGISGTIKKARERFITVGRR